MDLIIKVIIKGSGKDEKKFDELASMIDRMIVRWSGDANIACFWSFDKEVRKV